MVDLRGLHSKRCFQDDLRDIWIDLPSIVTHSRVLTYADDVKICLSYNKIEFGLCLQSAINRFQEWCSNNPFEFKLS